MPAPIPFSARSQGERIVLAGVIPFVLGAVVGVFLGISAGAYWGLSALAGLGGILAGLEHEDARDGARRGLLGGALFALGLLLAHALAGTDAKVSLGSFPPLLIVIDAIVGALLSGLGGHLARRRGKALLGRPPAPPEVRDDPEMDRFTISVDGRRAGHAAYRRAPGEIAFTHTEIEPEFEGRGLGSHLIREMLARVRAEGLAVLPHCPFVRDYIEGHPSELDLVPAERRAEFGLLGEPRRRER